MLPPDTRLLVWNTNCLRQFGGAEKAVHNLVNRFCELGIETWLVAQQAAPGGQTNEYFGPLNPAVKVYLGDFVNPWDSSGQPLHFLWKLLRYLVAGLRFGAFLRRRPPQIVHLHYISWDILLLAFWKLFFRYRLVVTFRAGETQNARQRRLSRVKIKLALRSADLATSISREICDRINAEYPGARVLYIPNGIDVEQLRQSARPREDIEPGNFVFCGRMVAQKNLGLLVDGFGACVSGGCRAKLYLVGDGQERDAIRHQVALSGLQESIIFLGALSHSETLGVISQSRCLVLSSLFEGMPQVALEAMAFGKPVIASDVGGLSDLVAHGETGYLYPIDRKDLLCEYLMELCGDSDRARTLGQAGLARLTRSFGLNQAVERYLELYESLLGDQAAGHSDGRPG